MMKNKFFLLLFVLITSNILAKVLTKTDSLQRNILSAKHDTSRIVAMINYGKHIKFENPDSAITCYNYAIKIADKSIKNSQSEIERKNFKKHSSLALHEIGNVYLGLNNLDEAKKMYYKSLQIRNEIDDKKGIGASYNNLGLIASLSSDLDLAIKLYQKSLYIRNEIGDQEGVAGSFFNIAMLFDDLGKTDSAFSYYQKSLIVYQLLDKKSQIANVYNNLSILYRKTGDFQKAIESSNSSLNIYNQINDSINKAQVFGNLGQIYKMMEDYDKALFYYNISLKRLKKNKDLRKIAYVLNNIGDVYLLRGNKCKGKFLFQQADSFYNCAMKYYEESYQEKINIDDIGGQGLSLLNIGLIYRKKADIIGIENKNEKKYLDLALEYSQKSLLILRKTQNSHYICSALNNLAELYLRNPSTTNKAIALAQEAYKISKESNNVEDIKTSAENLYLAYAFSGSNARLSRKFYDEYVLMKDSLSKEEDYKLFQQNFYKRRFEKKQRDIETQKIKDSIANAKEIEIKNLEIAKNKAEMKKQRIIIFASIAGLIIILGFTLILFRLFKQKKKANVLLHHQNLKIVEQNKTIEAEKEKSEKLLLNILPVETADELKNFGHATPRLYSSASILFTDFKGFTKSCTGLSPQQIVDELHMYFEIFDDIIEKYDLEKIKTIGDAYMCAGGLPQENTQHPIQIVKAGLEMQKFMCELKESRIKANQAYWELRLGIHTGSIVAGVVGKKKFAYDIWGSAVNIASRMETAGEPGRVNISETTYNYVKDFFDCEYRGKIEAKNVGAIDMYFVNGIK